MRGAVAGHDSANEPRGKEQPFWPHVVEDGHAWNVISAKEPYSKAAEARTTLRSSLLLGESVAQGAGRHQRYASGGQDADRGELRRRVGTARIEGAASGCRFARSSLHRSLGIRKEPGLGDVLNGQCEAGEAAVTTENIPHLSVVSSGAAVTYPARRWRQM